MEHVPKRDRAAHLKHPFTIGRSGGAPARRRGLGAKGSRLCAPHLGQIRSPLRRASPQGVQQAGRSPQGATITSCVSLVT